MAETGTGLKKETAAALSYVVGPITGIVMLLLEKNDYVRFHAMQSIVVLGGLALIQWLLGVTAVFAVFIPLTTLVGFILWLVLIYKALQGERWKVPYVSKYTDKLLK
ncbi:hypothetical protein A2803_03305 [Candidatus Woesebacteria bacterium RIFCSPHIGHO2_01_FULL_44_21]|uniref:DUF4870 domain-containing protein n=1 Tax=Candidatus Woesebacteria bacterium RIFCSPHIGHO2_01_FULL_44_21 TaxID=1802503 RepID=A0A1F7YZ80_9BACT|nr:MAG: hypothetical protein A2803_03305 [Candidatus Woesebacteria bacterium RIFCSPHIGHO2_01_FULL_44_21]OGM69180.1 MAG: hypothetical protein A2897_04935 [Candidatus Woesebacteria bacterium RIFCSPLOWO2_01_FULL_44_24b]